MRPRSTRSPSFESAAGRTVSEPTTAQSTTSIVPNAIEVKILLLAMNIPAIAISTVTPEISTAWPDVGGRAEERGPRLAAGCALLALAAEVEERVVDADRHADQQDHGRGRLVVAARRVRDERVEAERREHGGEREQDRQPGGDERAERAEQDEERERDRQPLGVREVLVERLADLVVRARVADLAHGDVGVALLHAGDGGEDRLDLVLRLVRVAA